MSLQSDEQFLAAVAAALGGHSYADWKKHGGTAGMWLCSGWFSEADCRYESLTEKCTSVYLRGTAGSVVSRWLNDQTTRGKPAMISIPLDKMTLAEKLEAMEALWVDLSRTPAEVPVPQWHRDVLRSRRDSPANWLDWEQVKASLREMANQEGDASHDRRDS